MKKSFLLLCTIIFCSVSLATDLVIENGEKINVIVSNCEQDEYSTAKLEEGRNGIALRGLCKPVVCITGLNSRGNSLNSIFGVNVGIYALGRTKVFLKDFKGKSRELREEMDRLIEEEVCRSAKYL